MKKFIAMNDLVVESVGRIPTFSARGTSTCIDMMLSMNLIPLCITGWQVCPDNTLLDCKRITFEVKLKAPAPRECRLAISKANWNLLRRQLDQHYDEPTFITQQWLDRAVETLKRDINWALTKACPTKISAAPHRPCWNAEVQELRRASRKAWREYFHTQKREEWDTYVEARKALKKGIRKGRRKSWRAFTESASDSKTTARLFKCIQKCQNESIGIMSDAPNDRPEETVNHLLNVHFPGNTTVEEGG